MKIVVVLREGFELLTVQGVNEVSPLGQNKNENLRFHNLSEADGCRQYKVS